MAFMVPVVKKDWDIYGSSAKSQRERQQRSARSRTTSETGHSFSRGQSFGSRPAGSCSAADGSWRARGGSSCRQSRSSSRASNLSQLASSPPARGVPSAARSQPTPPPPAGCPSQSAPSSFGAFHTKVVDRMLRALHLGERDGSRKA